MISSPKNCLFDGKAGSKTLPGTSFRAFPGQTFFLLLAMTLILSGMPAKAQARTVTDALGRSVQVPETVNRVICSGPGSLRLLTYLQAQGMAVAVDDIERRGRTFDARPYALAHPEFRELPLFGEFRGRDNPELIVGLSPQPQVILKTFPEMGHDPVELQAKTGIPVVVLRYGNLTTRRAELNQALEIMGQVVHRTNRAEEVTAYLDSIAADLDSRCAGVPADKRKTCFVGGIAKKGPHGFQSTEPGYPPFHFTRAKNVAAGAGKAKAKAKDHATVAKEMIVAWDPEVLFVDLSTIQLGAGAGALHELRNDPAYQALSAVGAGNVYGVLPYNWYTQNYGSIFANAYFAGKLLLPERFADVDPAAKADEIYTFLVGKPVFAKMNQAFGNKAFKKLELNN